MDRNLAVHDLGGARDLHDTLLLQRGIAIEPPAPKSPLRGT
jgi:hypothetical protein